MKQKRLFRKIFSGILAFVMIITSLPFMLVSAVEPTDKYDPTPHWVDSSGTEVAAKEVMFSAVLNSDNSIDVFFPRAVATEYLDGEITRVPIEIQGYIVTLTEIDGGQTNQKKLIDMYFPLNMVTKTETGIYARQITIKAEDIKKAVGLGEENGGFKTSATYDVGVTAVDNEYWVSETIHTVLNDTPYYNLTGDFSPAENWVAREMLNFETRYEEDTNIGGKEISSSGKDLVNGVDYVGTDGANGSANNVGINIDGKFPEMGANDSSSFHFWVSSAYKGTPFTFTTTWSREHYDFTGADEVWFYVDFRDVTLKKVAFNLRANEKYYGTWQADGPTKNVEQISQYGRLFSTAAAGDKAYWEKHNNEGGNWGTKGGIYYQNESGLWEETTMTDGYLTDFGGYRGFIRIPVDYFIAQEDQYITADNDNLLSNYNYNTNANGMRGYAESHMFMQNKYSYGIYVNDIYGDPIPGVPGTIDVLDVKDLGTGYNKTTVLEAANGTKNVYKLPVNLAGTPISKSLLVQQRFTIAQWSSPILPHRFISGMGYCLRAQRIDNVDYITSASYDTYNGVPYYKIDRAKGYSPLVDMIGAGFTVDGWSADSLHNSFDFDQVLFMRRADANTDANYDANTGAVLSNAPVQFPTESGKFASDRGWKVANYYDRTHQIPAAIAEFIDEYLGDVPSLLDYDTLQFLRNAVELYTDCFPYDDFEQNMHSLVDKGYTDAYNKYVRSRDFIDKYMGIDSNYYDAALEFEQRVELLPDPDFLDVTSTVIKNDVTELMGLYKSFDLDKLNLIGDGSELKFLRIYRMMIGDDVKAGHSIGAYPYIPFNNFENHYYLNETAFRYYNDGLNVWDSGGSKATDRNNVGSFTVYADSGTVNSVGNTNGWYPRTYNPSDTSYGKYAEVDGRKNSSFFSRISAKITANGFDGTKGATVNFDGALTGAYSIISVSYDGRTADNLANLKGLDLSPIQLNDKSSDGTTASDMSRYGNNWANSFVMYIDYSHVKDVAMNLQFIVDQDGTDRVYYFATGNASEDRIWMLDENGDWVEIPINTSLAASDKSTIIPNDGNPNNSLQYYQGFIRIPLSKFRTTDGTRLDNVLDKVKIKRVHVAFWTSNNSNLGKSVTVDGMGFTYDPAIIARASANPNAELVSKNEYLNTVTNLDEFFAVQTDDATAFAQAVYSLDPHASKQEFLSKYQEALAAYDNLSDYQKTLPDVQRALAYLDGYDDYEQENGNYKAENYNKYHDYTALATDYDALIVTDTWAPDYDSAAELRNAVAAIRTQTKLTDSNKLNIPGKTSAESRMTPYDFTTATIDYSLFGLSGTDDENIQKTIDSYEKGYLRLSSAERAAFKNTADYDDLVNAYKLALRVRELEEDRENIEIFYNYVKDLYTMSKITVEGKDVPEDLQMMTLNAYKKNADGTFDTSELSEDIRNGVLMYYYTSIFAKQMLVSSETELAQKTNYGEMADSLLNVYLNARTRTVTDASTNTSKDLPGGIAYYVDTTHQLHKSITNKIDNPNATDRYLSTAELNKIEYEIRKFEAFELKFQAIESMYNEYLHLTIPLPAAELELRDDQTQGAADISDLGYLFTMDNEATVANLTNQIYLPHVWARLDHNVTLQISSNLTMTQKSGTAQNKDINFTVGQLNGKSADDDGIYYSDYIGTFANRVSATSPSRIGYFTAMQVQINADDVADFPTGVVYEGFITVNAFDKDESAAYENGTRVDGDGNPLKPDVIATIAIPVRFTSSSSFYEISLPADIEVEFNALATEAPAVKVVSIMNKFDADNYDVLKVDLVGADAEHTMTLDTTEIPNGITVPTPVPTLKYTVGGAVTYKAGETDDKEIDTSKKTAFNSITVNGTGTRVETNYPLSIWVAEEQWKQAYVNKYKDTQLTFTADFTAAVDPNQP